MASTDHFSDAFVRETLQASMTSWRRNSVLRFEADAILFREIQSKKVDILMF